MNNERVPYNTNRDTTSGGASGGAFSGGNAGAFTGAGAGGFGGAGFGGAGFGFPGFPPYGYAAGYAGNYGAPNFPNFGAPFMPFQFPAYAAMPYDFNSVFQAYITALQSYTQNLQQLQQQFAGQQNQNQIAARYAKERYCILAKKKLQQH